MIEEIDHHQVNQLAEGGEDERRRRIPRNAAGEVKHEIDNEAGADKNVQEPEGLCAFPLLLPAPVVQACGGQRTDHIYAEVKQEFLHFRAVLRISERNPDHCCREQRDAHSKNQPEQRFILLQFFDHDTPVGLLMNCFCLSARNNHGARIRVECAHTQKTPYRYGQSHKLYLM